MSYIIGEDNLIEQDDNSKPKPPLTLAQCFKMCYKHFGLFSALKYTIFRATKKW